MDFNRIVDQLIRDAQAEGKFDNLPGRGRPLKLDETDENAETWAANHLLKNGGHRPAWLEEDLALQEALTRARTSLQRTGTWRLATLRAAQAAPGDPDAQRQGAWAESEWTLAQARFRESLAQYNLRQRSLNLKVPLERFQRPVIEAETEIARLSHS